MNRSEFIQTIMELYPNTFHEENVKQYSGWIQRYKQALPENLNFDKLLKLFDQNWKSTVIPPHPSFFLEFWNDIKPEKKIKQIEKIELTPEEKAINMQKFIALKEKLKKISEEHTLDDN